jgi:hypothetical protein
MPREADAVLAEVIKDAPGLVVISSSEEGHASLERNWIAYACPTHQGAITEDERKRYALCVSNAKRWLHIVRTRPARELAFDPTYKQVCLGLN